MMKRLLLLLLLLQAQTLLGSVTFHAVVIADTADKIVHNSASVDIKKVSHAMRKIARGCKAKMKLKVLSGSQVTINDLEAWYQKAHIRKHDILFFYFTGHGFALEKQNTIWPNLFFRTKKEGLPMEQLQEVLMRKKARFTVVFCDSCNKFGPVTPHERAVALSVQPPKVKFDFAPKKRGLYKMFRKRRGKVLASGAVRGTPSFGSNHGGYFTQAFLIALEEESRRHKPSWKRLFRKSQKLLQHAQQPQFRLYFR